MKDVSSVPSEDLVAILVVLLSGDVRWHCEREMHEERREVH